MNIQLVSLNLNRALVLFYNINNGKLLPFWVKKKNSSRDFPLKTVHQQDRHSLGSTSNTYTSWNNNN